LFLFIKNYFSHQTMSHRFFNMWPQTLCLSKAALTDSNLRPIALFKGNWRGFERNEKQEFYFCEKIFGWYFRGKTIRI